jgi:pimeloyl-ACP methyl ester carboxylesterase
MKDRAARLMQDPSDPRRGRVRVHTLPNSGHWVHVDNPEGLRQILLDHLV